MKQHSKLLLLIITAILVSACSQDQKKSNSKTTDNNTNSGRQLEYERSVTFLTAEGDSISTVDVAIADDNQERSEGLMNVTDLPSDKGMLFIFDDNQPRSFYMANTPLSLDIIFVNADKEIVRIHDNTQPYSDKNLTSGKPARYVIETNAGYCMSHDIREGMQVTF
ncbi:DUF192 domain-containing protein [Aliifodinibius salicampi]|uniref:DUF192 domain-containing protein n=1 Tax=Fodinibius salicampi TaxID=1920655 RepID=A0ABT3PWR7_9BACT|nr:DUF192 domain-containing protein [Fodinibius salicampi]MCW9712295.1 DUF192 domain-containing protein [Fodinibius salicampi]